MDISKCLEIKICSYQHYLRIAHYHYVKGDIRPHLKIYAVYGKGSRYEQYPRPVAAVVYAPPMPNIRGRNIALRGILDIPSNPRERMQVINKHIVYASRLICDPRFGRKGIASWLLQNTVHLTGKPIVESLSPVDDEAALLSRIGFKQIIIPTPHRYSRMNHFLRKAGISDELCKFPELVHKRISQIDGPEKEVLVFELQRFVNQFSYHQFDVHSLKRTTYILTKLVYPSWYHVWIEPKWLKTREKNR